MIPRSIFATAALSAAVFFVSCDKAAQVEKQANKAQAQATAAINHATQEAEQKAHQAQAEADKKIAEAQASFVKLREEFHRATTTNLAALDEKLSQLETKTKKAKAKQRKTLDGHLKQIRASREAFLEDFRSLENTTAATWDETKARLDRQWAALMSLLDKLG